MVSDRRWRADHLASLLRLQRPIQLPLGPVCVATPNDRLESINVNTAAAGDRLQSLQNGHHGSKAFKGSLTLFTFIADVATGPVRCRGLLVFSAISDGTQS